MLELNKTYHAEAFELLSQIDSQSVDVIYGDLPYGVTQNKWDSVIPLEPLWAEYKRIIKPGGIIIQHGQDKFSARLMLSNEEWHRYNLIWEKTSPTGHLNAKKMPLRSHEDLLIFYKSLPTYNPQKTTGHARKVSSASHKRNSKKTTNYGEHGLSSYDSTERYPKSVLRFASDKQKSALHPTQKPVALVEWLLKTYSNEGDVVLDHCLGSGTLAIAAQNTGRNWIGGEMDEVYYDIAVKRIEENKARLTQLSCGRIGNSKLNL